MPRPRPWLSLLLRPRETAPWRPWRFRMSHDVWGSPVVADGVLYVTSFEVHALDIASGRRRFRTGDVAWALAVADGRVHAADGPSLFTLQAADGTERWRVALDGWTYTLDAAGGAIVAGTRGGGVQVRSAIDGSEMWQARDAQQDYENSRSGPASSATRSTTTAAVGCARSTRVRSAAVDAAARRGRPVPSGAPPRRGPRLQRHPGPGPGRGHGPGAVALRRPGRAVHLPGRHRGGGLLRRLPGHRLRPRHGDRLAPLARPDGGRQGADPVVLAGEAPLVSSGDTVHAFDARTGAEHWRYAARADLAGVPASADGLVHVGSRDHSLHTLDLATGRLRWKLDTGGEITGTPVAADGKVFASSKDHCVYALDAALGTARTQPLGAPSPTRALARRQGPGGSQGGSRSSGARGTAEKPPARGRPQRSGSSAQGGCSRRSPRP